MSEVPKSIQRVGIVANPKVDDGHSHRLIAILHKRGVEVERFTEPTGTRENGGVDLVFVLGGDGTMLRASRMYPGHTMVGVNLGTLGFMSGMRPEELETGVEKVLDGGLHVQEYRMLEARTAHGVHTAINDVVLLKERPHQIASVDVAVNGENLVSYQCDGLIAATPLGSTAYALSAGGPLIAGDVVCFVLVPIAPHSLVSRPLVLGADQVVDLRVTEREALLSLDGGDPEEIFVGERLSVGLSQESVKIGRTDEWTWWRAVRRTFL
ncbi:MAG: NAD(+)/NADH kinase [Actinomycetota bacterium]|nr:NAD(+)/NADH kinase [Actinomycetota bacterium]